MCELPSPFLDVGKNQELSNELLRLQGQPCAPRQLFSLALPEYTCEVQAITSDAHVTFSWMRRLGSETVSITSILLLPKFARALFATHANFDYFSKWHPGGLGPSHTPSGGGDWEGARIPPNRADDKAYLTNTGFGLRSHALS